MNELKCTNYEKAISEMENIYNEQLKKQQEFKLQFIDLQNKMGET